MHPADLKHDKASLHNKLERLYTLSPYKAIDLNFRSPYLNLLQAFGNPHQNLPPTIHVAGTNGKGSIIAMLRAILETAGYSVHTYTSPHLKQFNERIVLAGNQISDTALETLIDEALTLNAGAETTFFEITTAMAFAAFARTPADILLLETGLGGRLDCTNVIESPIATIINTISRDHTEFLGETLPQIASEKAGIMKQNCPCIIGTQTPEAIDQGIMDTFKTHALKTGSPLSLHGSQWSINKNKNSILYVSNKEKQTYTSPNLLGIHQINNFATAIKCLETIEDHFPVNHDAIESGSQCINWPARLEKIKNEQLHETNELWLDGGHNDSAGVALSSQAATWDKADNKPLHLILGMKSDKSPEAFLTPLAPHIKSITLVPLEGIGTCLNQSTLTKVTNTLNIPPPHQAKTVHEAIANIQNTNSNNIRILACGSLYLAEQL